MSDVDEFTRRRLLRAFSMAVDDRRRVAESIGLPDTIATLLDALSLVVAEDSAAIGTELQKRRNVFWNAGYFLDVYDAACDEFPGLLTRRQP